MNQLLTLSATEALAKLKSGEVSSVELTKASLERMTVRKHINAYITETHDEALKMAAEADARRKAGQDGTLNGLPIGVKDLYCTRGVLTTAASHILNGFKPAYESTVTQKLWDAGAVMLGKLNMDEFAMGSSTETSFYGPTKNPWDESRVPGGSSGGSAAAVADYQCFAATGSDTGGSIRQPAALTGLVGIKPTYGRCSRFGMVAFASSLDQAGMFTRTVEDAALTMQVIAGKDEKDSTCSAQDIPDWSGTLRNGSIKGLRIGLPKEYFVDGMNPKVKAKVMEAIHLLEKEGAILSEITLPHTEYALAAYYIVAPSEAASNLARYDGMRYGLRVEGKSLMETYINTRTKGFGDEPKRRIMVGNYALCAGYYDAYYVKAMQIRTLLANEFAAAFEKVDVIMAPTAPNPAFKIGEKTNDPISMYLEDAFTIPTSMAGLPGMSMPTGTVEHEGVQLPVGLQIIGPRWNEERILQTAWAYQQLAKIPQPQFKI